MSNHVPENETRRLQALAGCGTLDSVQVSTQRDIFNVPMSVVSLIDRGPQSLKAVTDKADLSASAVRQADVIADQAAALAKQRRIFDYASALAKMGAWEIDLRTGQWSWSSGMYTLHEVDRSLNMASSHILNLYPKPDRRRLMRLMVQSQQNRTPFTFEGRMYTAKGNLRWVRIISDLECKDGKLIRHFGVQQDITDEKMMADRIQQLAQCDDLTGLYNRTVLREKLDEIATTADPSRKSTALFFLDLDAFQNVNDRHCQAAGDMCLQRIARRVRVALGSKCLVARIGGDKFAILVQGNASRQPVEAFAERIQRAVASPLRWKGHTFQLTSSIGIANRLDGQTFCPNELIREADLALYEAKTAGRNCHRTFRPALDAAFNEKFETLRDVRRALAHRDLELYYQPKVNLHDGSHMGFEALLRWNKSDRVLAPASFLAALEDRTLSMDIGDFVMASALDQAERWSRAGVPFNSIAINLSASQFRDPALAERLLSAIAAKKLHPSMIEVEVTEGVFLSASSDAVLNTCKVLNQGGVRIAFDDFGTGFASLTHLRDFPVDIIKIDRSFITHLGRGQNTTVIVNAIVGLAHNLSMSVVAEGVETQAQRDFLNAIGCDAAQGYLFGRPVPAVVAAQPLEPLVNPAIVRELLA